MRLQTDGHDWACTHMRNTSFRNLQIFTVIWVYFLRGWKAVPSVLWRVSGGSCVIVRRLEFLPSGLTPQFALSVNWEQLSWNLLPCWNVSVTLTSVFMHITSLVHAFGEGRQSEYFCGHGPPGPGQGGSPARASGQWPEDAVTAWCTQLWCWASFFWSSFLS